MDNFIGEYQYVIAWLVYITAGIVFCAFWWKLTSALKHDGWRDLFRGVAIVLIFTPWYASEAQDHVAPATIVVLLDLLVGSTDNGVTGSLVLLIATALMLAVLIYRRLRKAKAYQEG